MELVLDRFQRMNPPTFAGAESGLMAEGWLEHMEELFDAVEYSAERRLNRASIPRTVNQPGKSSVRDIPARQPSQLGGIPKRQVSRSPLR
ncbi:hypothetical protein F511_44759 [Dorcoceras hygrometricum]|uniref:Uncharacterized protein n=1 Tax=Dorcoceras hygrometricum TaxID=472368 RepID=A0A2Z6ZXM7_9LAMI|nr:hypothetical protein F511_44759 [Dorcoceras hygrometricum]